MSLIKPVSLETAQREKERERKEGNEGVSSASNCDMTGKRHVLLVVDQNISKEKNGLNFSFLSSIVCSEQEMRFLSQASFVFFRLLYFCCIFQLITPYSSLSSGQPQFDIQKTRSTCSLASSSSLFYTFAVTLLLLFLKSDTARRECMQLEISSKGMYGNEVNNQIFFDQKKRRVRRKLKKLPLISFLSPLSSLHFREERKEEEQTRKLS